MPAATLKPTPDQTYQIISGSDAKYNFRSILAEAARSQQQGDIAEACNMRFRAIQDLQDLLPEDEEVSLDWEHPNTQAAIEAVNLSAVDHFLIADYEMASALLELSLDLDGEDHLESSTLLAYCYLALGEYELFDEVINDISDKNPNRVVLLLWSSHLREESLPEGEVRNFKSRFAPYYAEFVAPRHEADQAYLDDIESERPTSAALARELWFKSESLWAQYPRFIEALRRA